MPKLYEITIQDPSGLFPYSLDAPHPERPGRTGVVKSHTWPGLVSLPEVEKQLVDQPERWFEWDHGSLTICWDGVDRIFHPAWCFIVIEEMDRVLIDDPQKPGAKPIDWRDVEVGESGEKGEAGEQGEQGEAGEKGERGETFEAGDEPSEFTVNLIPNKTSGYRNRVLTARPAVTRPDFLVIMQVVADEAKADVYLVKLNDSWLVQTDGNRSRDVKRAYLTHAEALRDPEHGPTPSA